MESTGIGEELNLWEGKRGKVSVLAGSEPEDRKNSRPGRTEGNKGITKGDIFGGLLMGSGRPSQNLGCKHRATRGKGLRDLFPPLSALWPMSGMSPGSV